MRGLFVTWLFIVCPLTFALSRPAAPQAIERTGVEDVTEQGYDWCEEVPLDHWAYNAMIHLQQEYGFLSDWPEDYFVTDGPYPACEFWCAIDCMIEELEKRPQSAQNENILIMLDVLRAEFAEQLIGMEMASAGRADAP
jgi:hypothetical protein